jgi:quinol monooxygenase YgiN
MLVNYVSFEVDTNERDAFDQWYLRLAADARQEKGCLVYDYLRDPQNPKRGITIAAWESEADIAAHRLHPSHVELLALGSEKWGMRDLRMHSWTEIGGYKVTERSRVDGTGQDQEGREQMHSLVREYQALSLDDTPGEQVEQ